MNAFATGASRRRGLVAVSSGLLRGMPRAEVEAVLAHEVAHIANGDMVTLSLLQGVLNTFVIFASRVIGTLVDSVLSRNDEERRGPGPGYWIAVLVLELALGVLATIVVMWFSRHREYRADAGAARLVGAGKMAGALRRLQHSVEGPSDLPSTMSAFGIRGGGAFMSLFASHPPFDSRIRALAKMR